MLQLSAAEPARPFLSIPETSPPARTSTMGHGEGRSQRKRRTMTESDKADRAAAKAQKEQDMRSTGTTRMQQALAGTLAGRVLMLAVSCCSPVECK